MTLTAAKAKINEIITINKMAKRNGLKQVSFIPTYNNCYKKLSFEDALKFREWFNSLEK